jgi:Mrp family chromosome partitioning ATPase
MAFLPAIIKSPLVQTTEILVSDATKRLFDRLRLSYDYVVVDLSPLGPVADVRATTNLVDSYVFVIEWGCTNTSAVQRALRSAPDVNDNLLGVALNKTDLKLLKRYDAHLSEYYSNERYEH